MAPIPALPPTSSTLPWEPLWDERWRGVRRACRRIIDALGGRLPPGRDADAEGVAVEPTDAIHPVGGEHALLDTDEGEGAAGVHHGPMAQPVSALRPEGRSTDSTGTCKPLIVATIFVISGDSRVWTPVPSSVDHQVRRRQPVEPPPRPPPLCPRRQPLVGGPPGIPRQLGGIPQRNHLGPQPQLPRKAGQYIAVATVVAGTGEDPPASAVRPVVGRVGAQCRPARSIRV